MKVCPNCNEKHNLSRSEYCCREITKECSVCNKEYTYKCRARAVKACSKKCSSQLKNNSCLNCGDPCKEKYCKKDIEINCKNCGKEHITKCTSRIGIYCSGVCAAKDPEIKERAKQTQLANHCGVYAFNTEKQRETMIERYGDITPAKNKEVKRKAKETQFKNHGGKYAFNTEKQEKTMMKKYGSKGRLGDPEELRKQHELMIEKYGVKTPSEHPEFLEKAMSKIIEKHGQLFGSNSRISKVNLNFGEKIKRDLGADVEYELYLNGNFFDIYIPEYKIAIELNPTITHNSSVSFVCKRNKCKTFPCEKHLPLAVDYHFKKSKVAMDNELSLLQVFEWQSQDEIISKIKQMMNLDREPKMSIDSDEQGKYKLSIEEEILFDNQKIVSTLKDFIRKVDPKEIKLFLDFNSNTKEMSLLESLGFIEKEPTGPILVLHKRSGNKMIRAENVDGSSLLSNNEIEDLEKKGYLKVYISGNRVFNWNKS